MEVNYPILSDPEKTTASAFGVLNDAGSYARRWTFYIGVDGLIKRIQKEVDVRSHGQDVANVLEELNFPKKP